MINAVRQYFIRRGISFTFLVSHPDKASLSLLGADHAFIEPSYNANNNHHFYQEIVKKYKVDLIIPGESSLLYFKKNESIYHELGSKILLCASLALLEILKSKSRTYQYFENNDIDVAIPRYQVVNTLESFIDICTDIQEMGSIPCFKPDISQGASGFRVVDNSVSFSSLVKGFPSHNAPLEYYIYLFSKTDKFPELIVMEFLSGVEVTLDILSYNSNCLCYFPRNKEHNDRFVKDKSIFKPLIKDFIDKSGIQYVFNIQLRYYNNIPFLLEVNPRYSGGSYLAEENGYPMLSSAIDLILYESTQEFAQLDEFHFKMIENYIKI